MNVNSNGSFIEVFINVCFPNCFVLDILQKFAAFVLLLLAVSTIILLTACCYAVTTRNIGVYTVCLEEIQLLKILQPAITHSYSKEV